MPDRTAIEVEMFWRRARARTANEQFLVDTKRMTLPPAPRVTLYFDGHITDWMDRGCRIAITGTGRIITGDSQLVGHEDMVKSSCFVGEGERLIAGCIIWYQRTWVTYAIQNFLILGAEGKQPTQDLCSRLSTWGEFFKGERLYWPEPGEFGSDLAARIAQMDLDNPLYTVPRGSE